MRTTLNIEEELLNKAANLTGIKEKTSLVRLGLEALIERESSRRLAKLGGTEKDLEMDSPQKSRRHVKWSLWTLRYGWRICGMATSGWKPC
jgi:Arc/MetJ family transcription regulator